MTTPVSTSQVRIFSTCTAGQLNFRLLATYMDKQLFTGAGAAARNVGPDRICQWLPERHNPAARFNGQLSATYLKGQFRRQLLRTTLARER
jgi:hypothetical protein